MRSEGDFIKITDWLLPLSWMYGLGVRLRNFLFDTGVLKSRAYDIPVISVGNITVGGSGKTPHVEYLVRLLKDKARVAVLSRGYKRKSRGYVLATPQTSMRDIGDEPFQMHHKFDDIYVAVDRKRTNGIQRLTTDQATSDVDVILLDDAYQHRYVKPGINILLVDYHRLIIYDKLLPAGRLREPKEGKRRADIVIVTKCPRDLKPMEYRVLSRAMDLRPYQDLYFTSIDYCDLRSLFSHATMPLSHIGRNTHVLLITGIASPKQLILDLKPHTDNIHPLSFPDHHMFTTKDIKAINKAFEALPSPKMIVTTEKDSVRLQQAQGLDSNAKDSMYVLPIKVTFMAQGAETFDNKIINYVRENSKDSILAEKKANEKTKTKKKIVFNSTDYGS